MMAGIPLTLLTTGELTLPELKVCAVVARKTFAEELTSTRLRARIVVVCDYS